MINQRQNKPKTNTHTFSLSQLSHEIGNPLTLIYSTTQLLSRKHPELNQDELWVQLIKDIDYLKDLNRSLSDFNHSDQLSIQPANISQLFDQLKTTCQPYAQQSNIHFITDIQNNIPLVDCDILKLKQAMLNLIKNSFEATSENGTVKITASFRGKFLMLTVSDSGKGIPKNQLNEIFEPFTTYKADGSGLGLAITKKIITAHHGTINVQSRLNGGTHFIIQLPCHQPV